MAVLKINEINEESSSFGGLSVSVEDTKIESKIYKMKPY